MPSIQPISLTVGSNTEVYNPVSNSGKTTQYVDSSPTLLADWKLLKFDVRPAAAGNSGHLVEALMVRPNPVPDQAGCCVDKNNAPASTITIRTLLHKTSTADEKTALTDALKALVQNTDYLAVVRGAGFY